MKKKKQETAPCPGNACEERSEKIRSERISILLTEEEKHLLDHFLKVHRIRNRSRWMRRIILSAVQEKAMDSALLFSEHEMRR